MLAFHVFWVDFNQFQAYLKATSLFKNGTVNMVFCTKKSWLWGLIASIFFLVFYSACTSTKPLSQSARTFREQTLEDFERLTSKLVPALDSDSPVIAAGAVIKDFLLDLHGDGRQILGVGLLDTSGNYLTGYRLEDKLTGKLRKDEYKGMNFSSFEGVEKIVKYREIVQAPLYFQDTRVLVIGFPLMKEDNLLVIVYFSFDSHEFEKEWGISEQEFSEIDFSV